jgi:aryl-alcohol dehydrogenase-like predicted oxidoreductase
MIWPTLVSQSCLFLDGTEGSVRSKSLANVWTALAWVLAQGDHIIPIPGTKRRKYLEENAAAADVFLSSDDTNEQQF